MPHLLLDIDGVVVRDRHLFAHIKHRAALYVQSKLVNCSRPEVVNSTLYLAYGHTARGLKEAFRVDASDYNEFVYDKNLMTHLGAVLETDQFKKDAEIINNLTAGGWAVTLFTNAPYQWAHRVGLGINDQMSIHCPGPDASRAVYKPDPLFYESFDDGQKYYFVDDSLKNLGAVRHKSNWRTIFFTEDGKIPRLWCPQVGSIPELSDILLHKL